MRRKRFGLALVAVAAATSAQAHDATSLPLGDGHVSHSPKVGYVYSCGLAAGGGGAHRTGEWIHGDTWNPLDKPHVQGRIYWPDAVFDMQSVGDSVEVKGNGLPVGQPMASFRSPAMTRPTPTTGIPTRYGPRSWTSRSRAIRRRAPVPAACRWA